MDAPPIRYVESADGARVACSIFGEGPPVVVLTGALSHLGFRERGRWYRRWDKRASDYGISVVSFDLPGFGLSSLDNQKLAEDRAGH